MILAVEINDSSINIAQASVKKGSLSRLRCICEGIFRGVDDGNIADVDYVAERIREILCRNRINTRRTVFVINSKSVIVRRLRLPLLKKRNEIMSMIGYELSQLMPFNSSDYRMHYEVAEDCTYEKYAWYIIYCIPEKLLAGYGELALKSGLKPAGFEIYCSCVNKLRNLKEKVSAFADIGEKRISFTVMNRGVSDFSRTAEIYHGTAGDIVAEEAAIYMDSSYPSGDNPLNICLDEIIRCIRYYQSIDKESKISRMYIFNSEIKGLLPSFIESMSDELPTVEIVTELPIFLQGIDEVCYDGRCFMPVLAALNEGRGSFRLHKSKYNEISDFKIAAAMAVILVSSLFFIMGAVFAFTLHREYEHMEAYVSSEENILLNNEIDRLKAENYENEKSIADMESLKNKIEVESYADSEIFRCIFSALPENTLLKSMHVGIAGVSADCTSGSIEEIALFLSNLRRLSYVQDIYIDEVSRNGNPEEGYVYTVHCVLRSVRP